METMNEIRGEEEYRLVERNYGKNSVKLLHVKRDGKYHSVKELEVSTRLTLSSEKDFLAADNTDIIATDTQKNIVYVLAKKYGVRSAEDFGLIVANFFLEKYKQVLETTVTVEEYPWQRMSFNHREHNHAFIYQPTQERYAVINQKKNGLAKVTSGMKGLRVLKTTQSAFADFGSDEFRTLPDSSDRIFSTIITASWTYSSTANLDFDKQWNGVRACILEEFAGHPDTGVISQSVQHTLYKAERRVLQNHPQIESIRMEMPNKHYWDLDLSKFPTDMVGRGVNKTVFQPVDKPAGLIHALLTRSKL